jgi:hypothetical protein
VPKRSTRALTSEQKSDIQLKAAYTKRLNRDYKQKLSELSSSPISTEEFSQQVLELKQNVTKNRNQFRQQLSEQNSTLGTSTADSSVLSSNAVRSSPEDISALRAKHRKRGGALGTLEQASTGGRRSEGHGIQTYDEVVLTAEDQALYDKMTK